MRYGSTSTPLCAWRACGTRFWPTLYLIDKNGRLRYEHIGEGAYDETEAAIAVLRSGPIEPLRGENGGQKRYPQSE